MMRNDINLLPNQRLCPKCNLIVNHINKSQATTANTNQRQCKTCYHSFRSEATSKYNLKRLLNDELESFYWVGFLMADGWFSEDKQRFSLEIGEQDFEHLNKFAKYLSYTNKIKLRSHTGKTKISNSFI